MRRKPGTLVPTEQAILEAAARLRQNGFEEFHGFQIAKEIKEIKGSGMLIGYGTLYRALNRLQALGFLESRWEEQSPSEGNRPRRRYYRFIGKVVTTTPDTTLTPVHREPRMWGMGVMTP